MFALALYVTFAVVMREIDLFHVLLVVLTAAVLIITVVLAAAGVSMPVCLLVLALAPLVTVVGYETEGHRHVADIVERIRTSDTAP